MHGIPKKFIGATLEDYLTADEYGDPTAVKKTEQWLSNMESRLEEFRGLVLWGKPGGGKSMLAAIVLQECLTAGHTGYFTDFEAYIRKLRRLMKLEKGDDHGAWQSLDDHIIGLRNRVEVLIVNDVGKEHTTHTRFAEDELDFLLRQRWHRGRTTIVTTNLMPEEWAVRYSESMESFIHEVGDFIKVRPRKDYRRRRR